MASFFGHTYTALAISSGYSKRSLSPLFLFLGLMCSVIPDADVVTFSLGIPYGSFWGHRGFFHSIFFALLLACILTSIFYKKKFFSKHGAMMVLYLAICTLSHGLLDAMTSGGLGVAFFSPFDQTRYFFPWRPIKVSPVKAVSFFSEWGIKVLKSEAIWIGIPASVYILFNFIIKRSEKKA